MKFPTDAAFFARQPDIKQTVLFRPRQGAGPFPGVVLAPTCGGVGSHLYDWAERFTGEGYVALIVDSLTPRHVADNCLRAAWEAEVSIDTVNSDLSLALAHLRSLPLVKGDAIGLAGYSFGAVAAIKLASETYQKRLPSGVTGLKAIAFFYGACVAYGTNPPQAARLAYQWPNDVVIPVIAFLGAIDNEAFSQPCVNAAEHLQSRGLPVTYRRYPETTHSFDERFFGTQGRQVLSGARGPFFYRYNPVATEDAWREMKALFDSKLKGAN